MLIYPWVAALFLATPPLVAGHASLIEPPSRAAMNLYGFPQNPVDYQHNEGFCGGFSHQFSPAIGGRCGICGDAWDANPRQHEAPGGKFANGIITRTYRPGQDIEVKVDVTANHKGYFTFKICANDNTGQDPGQECFDQPGNLLQIYPGGGTRFPITTSMGTGPVSLKLRLPDITCSQCILQWTYTAGNNWGNCPDGSGAIGCGPQEHFRACSDIRIQGNGYNPPPLPPITTPSPTPTPAPTPSPGGGSPPPPGHTCVGVGTWAGDASMSQWCFSNCYHTPPNCPPDQCSCVDNPSPPPSSGDHCQAIGPWAGNTNMDTWCNQNCLHSIPYCPKDTCECSESGSGSGSGSGTLAPIVFPTAAPGPDSTFVGLITFLFGSFIGFILSLFQPLFG